MSWKFDQQVSEYYLDHVRCHIPDFNTVIDKTVECCLNSCDKEDLILDFGCATGYTLKNLYDTGFRKLYGVDSSQDMLDKCDTPAQYICTNDIPKLQFKAIIANWVLHFNFNKEQLIKNIYDQLDHNGIAIISDKLSQSNFIQDRYYNWKQSQGVSIDAIRRKEHDLIGVMNLHSIGYYYDTLTSVGFKSVEVFHGSWGFVSLLARK